MVPDAMQIDEVSNKRKRDIEDNGDREQKKAHVEKSRVSIDDLHLDVGDKYLLCRRAHNPSQPSLCDDLFPMYGLNDLAESVARFGPDGHSKGIKLRKTYKNHIKTHGVSGQFDSQKREFDSPESLFMMMIAPAEEWDAEHTRGKEIENGLGLDDSVLSKAFTMSKGTIPKTMWDASVLGDMADKAEPAKAVNGAKAARPQAAGVSRTIASEKSRPQRATKKRGYGDDSFEGYGEGYVDDDAHEVGYSTGGDADERGGNRKRPKKNTPGHGYPSAPVRHNSYGPGMVGA
jgi:hypothetical protein